ncbi:MAG: RNA polymerase sigma factor [Phycisphaerales bacterium]|nr:MAG: RNA polymerase sigma factor [Phycisphaerales bacterium]
MAMYPLSMVLPRSPYRNLGLRAQGFVAEILQGAPESFSDANEPENAATEAFADLEDSRLSRQGDPDAYRRLIERHQQYIAQIMWRFSRDHLVHEELVQDVFVEAYLSLRTYRAKAPFAHWLSRIATRVGYRYWKQIARRQATESFTLEQWDQLPGEEPDKIDPAQAASQLHALLQQLPPRDRLVLTLRYLEECDVAETARRTGWTKTMVKVQALRARKKLERLFRESGKELIP